MSPSSRLSPRRVLPTLFLLCSLLIFIGCDKSAKDHLNEGKGAIASKNPDKAETALKNALQKDPSLVEAERSLIRVHILRRDFDKAEADAIALATKLGIDGDPKQLAADKKQLRYYQDELYEELYKEWAASLDPKNNPQKLEEVVTKGLSHKPKDVRLNTILVDLYISMGSTAEQDKKPQDAADIYEKAIKLPLEAAQRTKLTQDIKRLRRDAFLASAQARFDAQIKPKLAEQESFDADKGLILIRVELPVDKSFKPNKPEDIARARELALPQVYQQAKLLSLTLADQPQDTDLSGTQPKNIEVAQENLDRTTFSLVASVPLNELLEYALFIHSRAQERQAKPQDDKKPQDDAPPQETPPSDAPNP